MQQYDSYNFLDAFVLNLLVADKGLSSRQIFDLIQKKLPVSEFAVNTCLLLMHINGLVNMRFADARNFYEITDDGNDFLKRYQQIKSKILELQ